jgi:hypothetical protein
MSRRWRLSYLVRSGVLAAVTALMVAAPVAGVGAARADIAGQPAGAGGPVTAWRDGQFVENVPRVVSRSDVVLGQPNQQPDQSMPLGNGRLGVAAWAADGLTAQLNRVDTLPGRLSPGQVSVPGLAPLVDAADYRGRLDLYDGMLTEAGGGMSARVWVRSKTDELVVDVHGADPGTRQTAEIHLWQPRTPAAQASGSIGDLAETWVDNTQPGASGQTFGSLAAITAVGRDVTARVVNPLTVQVSFLPKPDGSYQVLVAAPHWAGGNAMATARAMLAGPAHRAYASPGSLLAGHLAWWHAYWHQAGLMRLSSAGGVARYMENIATMYLYTAAAEDQSIYPGSNNGGGNLFAYEGDTAFWDPAAFWHWNLRMQTAANMGAGVFALNSPYFRLYRGNLTNIENWTKKEMGGRPGICVPETMRFNGAGIEYETWLPSPGLDCDQNSPPYYNARTLTTGAEVGLWVWRQYLYTGDRSFLAQNYPLMAEPARFLLAYATTGPHGHLNTDPSNAHETQWDVKDPTTDIAAERALFPVVIQAATLLHKNPSLVAQLKTAIPRILPFPRTDAATHTKLLTSAADASGTDVIAPSYQPAAPRHNVENIGMEPVWPYEVITNDGSDAALARRTFEYRLNKDTPDWSYDAVDAAMLGLASSVRMNLIAITEGFQSYVSGLASLSGGHGSRPYVEQPANVALALQLALVQDTGGVLQIAPAWPSGWQASGTVYIYHQSKVDVQVEHGTVTTAVIQAGSSFSQPIRNPWPGQAAEVVAYPASRAGHTGPPAPPGHGGRNRSCLAQGTVTVAPTTATQFTARLHAGCDYLIERAADPTTAMPFAPVTGSPATTYRTLGSRQIGLPAPQRYTSLPAAFDNVGITSDTDTAPGNLDGAGYSFSAQALAAAGITPGSAVHAGGLAFTWPDVQPGQPDNVEAGGQIIEQAGTGTTLGFLATATFGPASGTGVIHYTDGTSQQFTLSAPDWYATPPSGSDPVITAAYRNTPGNGHDKHPVYVYYAGVPLASGKTVQSVTLPSVSPPNTTSPSLHIFAMAIGTPTS